MNYNTWKTRFDETKTVLPGMGRLSLTEQAKLGAKGLLGCVELGEMSRQTVGAELERLAEEYLWLLDGKPHYNVHPLMVPHLYRCRLDAIPANYLEVPGGFDAVHVRFAAPDPCLAVTEMEYVRSILVSRDVFDGLGGDSAMRLLNTGRRPTMGDWLSNALVLRIDLGDRSEGDGFTYFREWVVTVHLDEDKTLEEEFFRFSDRMPEKLAPGTVRYEVVKNCLRLLATLGFMCNQTEDGLLEYDVLAKDRQRYSQSDEEGKQRIIDRARRRGKVGWNVGTNELFVGEQAKWSSAATEGTGRELTHAHIRTGHLHAVRFGEGRRKVKVKWFRPTVVRPDLPFASVPTR